MSSDSALSQLCKNYVYGSESDRIKLTPKIIDAGSIIIGHLISCLCEASRETRAILPKNPTRDVAKRGLDKELADMAIEAELFWLIPESQLMLRPKVKAVGDALVGLYKRIVKYSIDDGYWDKFLYENREYHRQMEITLQGEDKRSWAMALTLYETAGQFMVNHLDDATIKWIKFGYGKTGTSTGRSKQQVVYAMLYNLVTARSGDKASQDNIRATARNIRVEEEHFKRMTLFKAYAYWVML